MTYVLFPDEGHGFARPENSLAFNAVTEAFLAQHLGGRYEPIGKAFAARPFTVPTGAEDVPGLKDEPGEARQKVRVCSRRRIGSGSRQTSAPVRPEFWRIPLQTPLLEQTLCAAEVCITHFSKGMAGMVQGKAAAEAALSARQSPYPPAWRERIS